MDQEFEALQKKVKFGQRALLITVAVLLGLLWVSGKYIGPTDEYCENIIPAKSVNIVVFTSNTQLINLEYGD